MRVKHNFLKLPILFSASCISLVSQGQSTCSLTVDAGSNIAICSPAIVQLNGSSSTAAADLRSISWTPITGLSSSTIYTPSANIVAPITYYLTVNAFSDSNMIVNGNFNNGITGFTTQYIPGTGGSFGLLSNEGTYAVDINPRNTHMNFSIFGDHTSGSGNMLVVNGDSSVPVSDIVCQTVTVIPNTEYIFSIWGASCVPGSPAVLALVINGVQVGPTYTLSATAGIWQQFTYIWNSGINTTATICVEDQNILVPGNDFALDDFSFRESCRGTDSVIVSLGAVGIMNLGTDTSICLNQSITLNATVPSADHYQWSTGDTIPQIIVTSAGQYIATASFGGVCPVSDTINIAVDSFPQFSLGPDSYFCSNDSLLLDATAVPATSYLWQNGNSSPVLYASVAGTYSVTVTNGSCKSYDTISVNEVVLPVFSIGNDTTLCVPDTIVLKAPALSGFNFAWSDGSTFSTLTVRIDGVYWLEIEDSGCTAKEFINISEGACGSPFIPNAFTPNGDSVNDWWQVYNLGEAVNFNVSVFNRWGEIVFSSADPEFQWNGTHKSNACTAGVYFYVISGNYITDEKFSLNGRVTLLR